MKLRIGLIGPGSFGYLHLNAYKKNENCELIAIASRTEQHAKQAAEKFDVPNYYWNDDWIKMFDKDRLDAVSICSPNYLHASMSAEALKNNINVLCEKPICISEKELDDVERMLNEKKLIYFSSFQRRYIGLFNHIKEIINNEVLGDLTLVRYYFSHYGPYTSWRPSSQERWFFDSKKAGGGVLMDLGVHCIDILRYLIGEVEKIEGYSYATSCKNIKDEDNCNVLFRFKNGTAGIISVSWCNEPMELLELYGTKGTLKLDLHSTEPISIAPKKLKRHELIRSAFESRYTNDILKSHLLLTNHFINCILKGKQEHPDFIDGKRATEFVLKSYSLKKS